MHGNEEKIAQLLDKTTDFDKDERYMATSDLCAELNKNAELGPYLESRVCSAVLKQLDDKSNDVQSIAVKCLGILVTKVQVAQVADISAKLCDLILNGKPELRDIYSIGLKTIVSDVSQATGAAVATNVCARLLPGLSKDKEPAVTAETLDILTDLLRRFGRDIATEHETIMNMLMVQLLDASPLVRKRATACVGSLGVMASDVLVTRLIEHLIRGIRESSDSADVRTLIQTTGTLSRTAGHRLGRHLDAVIDILVQFCGDPEDESMQNESSDELRSNCFQAFEAFIIRCHNEITPHLEKIIQLVMQFIQYDPNYNYGDSADEDEPMDEDEEEYSEEEGDYSDDDDTSWKVRRAGLRVLAAVITTRPEMLEEFYVKLSQPLISRFKEREENVRIDVLGVFTDLLRETRKRIPSANISVTAQHPPTFDGCLNQLGQRVKIIVVGANKQFGQKASVQSRCAVLALLSELAMVQSGKLGDYVDMLLPNVLHAATDKHSDLKLDALSFLRLLIDTHSVEPFRNHIALIVDTAIRSAKDEWYKTVTKALELIESIVRIIRPEVTDTTYKAHAVPLFEAVLPSLKAHDIDQAIKESAISSMGQIVAVFGDELSARNAEIYPLLMERLKNEITRVQSIKAIGVIARSKLDLDLSLILEECTMLLADLLRQQSRGLKQATLDTLNELVVHKGKQMKPELLREVVSEASALLVDVDLQLCRLGIHLVSNVLVVCPGVAAADAILVKCQPNALTLCHSSMLQGPTLEALKHLFAQLTKLSSPGSSFSDLFAALMVPQAETSKHSVLNVARCVAAICVAAPSDTDRQTAFAKFIGDIKQQNEAAVLSLYCLGEFGRHVDLSAHADVKEIVLQCFNGTPEEIKAAAAYAFGSICVGNMSMYLETVIVKLEQGENSYLLLSSLREVIADHAVSPSRGFVQYVDRVLPVLGKLSEREEEGVRNMVAECLGKLAVTDGPKVLPVITQLCASSVVGTRWTAVTSLKYALTTTSTASTSTALFDNISPFLAALEDEDLGVRRAALLVVNTAAHHHPVYLAPYVRDRVYPVLLTTTDVKLERVVDLGPFKHKVDDGLPLRKAAYTCIDTLLDVLPQLVDISLLLPHLKRGLGDQDDIQLLSHQILIKICRVQPGSVVGALDTLLEPIDKTLSKKVKEDQVGPEVERIKDLIRSALRAVDAISGVRDADAHPKFAVTLENIKRNKTLAPLLEAVKSEGSSA